MPNGDHVLISNAPDRCTGIDGMQTSQMGTCQTGGMWAGKTRSANAGVDWGRQIACFGQAEVDQSFGQQQQRFDAPKKLCQTFLKYDFRIGRPGLGLGRGNKDCRRVFIGQRYAPERAAKKGWPHPA